MTSRVRAWRAVRRQPLWLQLLLAACLLPVAAFALFLLYAFVAIALFGI